MKKIKLTRDQWALVDDEDYEMLMEYKWYALWMTGGFRAVRNSPRDSNGKQDKIQLHRVITNAPQGMVVDNINGKPLENIYLGMYKTKEEAALAYNKKAIELFGEFAQLNIIDKSK